MREATERVIELGFTRSPKKVVDEVERVSARMLRQGWALKETLVEDSLGRIHLFFERDIPDGSGKDIPSIVQRRTAHEI
ncbi:MAG: hypothetical protein JW768_10095 [Chitinispirillaceae bacterium]|nr:hypothetical protein [Chitinispirillaceae bacterium]